MTSKSQSLDYLEYLEGNIIPNNTTTTAQAVFIPRTQVRGILGIKTPWVLSRLNRVDQLVMEPDAVPAVKIHFYFQLFALILNVSAKNPVSVALKKHIKRLNRMYLAKRLTKYFDIFVVAQP